MLLYYVTNVCHCSSMVASYHSPSLHPCARDGSSRCVTCATRPPLCTVHLDHIDHRMLRVVQSGEVFIEAIHATAPTIYTTNEMTREIIECMSTLIAHCLPNVDDARAATIEILGQYPCLKPVERQTIIDALGRALTRARARGSASDDGGSLTALPFQTCTAFPNYIPAPRLSLIRDRRATESEVYDALIKTSADIGLYHPDPKTITIMLGIVHTSAVFVVNGQRITRKNFWDHVQKLQLGFDLVRSGLNSRGPHIYAGYVHVYPLSAKVFRAMYPSFYNDVDGGGPARCPRALFADIELFAKDMDMPLEVWETQLCPPTTIDTQFGKVAACVIEPPTPTEYVDSTSNGCPSAPAGRHRSCVTAMFLKDYQRLGLMTLDQMRTLSQGARARVLVV